MSIENEPQKMDEHLESEIEKRRASMGRAFVDRHAITDRMSKVKHKIIILSGKGGVGKSTVAVNLATSLALAGKKVGLLDIDIHGPSIPKLTGLEGHPLDGTDSVIFPVRKGKNLYVMSIGFMTRDSDEAVIWRGPLKFSVIRQFLRDVDWGELDYLVIDSPPGTGDEPLTIAQLLTNLDGAVIVTTPQDIAINDVRRSIVFCRTVGMPIIGVVENMSGFVCPHCGETTNVFKVGGGEKMAEDMGVPFLGRIPIDPRIVESSDMGVSFLEHYARSAASEAFRKVIQPILSLPVKTPATTPSDLGNPEN